MAWADVIARGSGRTEYRLVIEGYATEWVTASDLAGASPDGRTRRVGLKRQSLSFGDRIVPIEAKLEGNGVTAEIVDIDGQATREFARRGAILATLKVNLGSLLTDTGMTVSNTSQFVAGQHYHINTECFLVSTIDSSTGLTVGRRKRQTLEQAHFAFDGGGESVQAPITDHPITTRGRRCYLYGYGDGEAGDGTLIWRGKITAPPSRNGMTSWHLNIDPIVSVFDQETSSKDLRPTHVRGYYFPWNCALTIAFAEYERFDGFDLPSGLKARHDLKLTGFYPDQGTLAQAINAFCQSTVNTDGDLSGRFNCQVSLGRPTIYYKGNSSDRYPACRMLGLDNKWVGYRVMKTVLSGDAPVDMWGIQANQGYRIEFDGGAELLTEPFCWLGGHRVNAGEDLQGSDTSVQSTYPPNRLYLASSINVSTGGCVELANIDFGKELMHATFDGTLARVTADSARISVTAYDSTNNYVTLANLDRTTGGGHMRGDSEIRATQVFGVDGNIADFRDGLVSSSINANAGEAPFVTTSDVADWQTVIDAAATARSRRLSRFRWAAGSL